MSAKGLQYVPVHRTLTGLVVSQLPSTYSFQAALETSQPFATDSDVEFSPEVSCL